MKNISRNPDFMNLVTDDSCFTKHQILNVAWDEKCNIHFNTFYNNVIVTITQKGKMAKTELCLKASDAKDLGRFLIEFAERVEENYGRAD